jgi:hypothetical protein
MEAMTRNNPVIKSNYDKQKGDLTDKNGIPLSANITSANIHDIKVVTKMLSIMQFSIDILNYLSQGKIQMGSVVSNSIYALI